jgi:hypothetical protein
MPSLPDPTPTPPRRYEFPTGDGGVIYASLDYGCSIQSPFEGLEGIKLPAVTGAVAESGAAAKGASQGDPASLPPRNEGTSND